MIPYTLYIATIKAQTVIYTDDMHNVHTPLILLNTIRTLVISTEDNRFAFVYHDNAYLVDPDNVTLENRL